MKQYRGESELEFLGRLDPDEPGTDRPRESEDEAYERVREYLDQEGKNGQA